MVVKIQGKKIAGPYDKVLGEDVPKKKLPHFDVKGEVSKTKSINKQMVHESHETVPVAKALSVPESYCEVGCSGGRTLQTAPFESVKIEVSLKMPCSKDDIPATWEMVSDWVGDRLAEFEKETKGGV